jgi:hypothetical protein
MLLPSPSAGPHHVATSVGKHCPDRARQPAGAVQPLPDCDFRAGHGSAVSRVRSGGFAGAGITATLAETFAAGTGTPLAVSELAYPAAQCSHSGADCGKLRRVLPVAAASDADTA